MAISDWSSTPGSNTTISSISIAEGCPPGNINNAIREVMAAVKSWYSTFSAFTLGIVGSADASAFRTAIGALGAADMGSYTIPIGGVVYHAASTPPSGYLECNGAAVSRTTYANLYAIIGTTHGVGDGLTTFNLPDLRGEFVRGYDNGRGVDPSRAFGSAQTDDIKPHTHTLPVGQSTSNYSSGTSLTGPVVNASSTSDSAGTTETRPRNIALLPIIKY